MSLTDYGYKPVELYMYEQNDHHLTDDIYEIGPREGLLLRV